MGYLVPGHYNFSKLEKRHYYSRILKFAITILDFPRICHGIRMKTIWAQLQAYTKTYISSYFTLLSMTCGPHLLTSSSSSHLPSSSSHVFTVQCRGAGLVAGGEARRPAVSRGAASQDLQRVTRVGGAGSPSARAPASYLACGGGVLHTRRSSLAVAPRAQD
jgi:hypothetical protein